MTSAAKGISGSGPSHRESEGISRTGSGDLTLAAEIRRNIRAARGYSSTPMFKNGGGRTLTDTIKMAIAVQGHSTGDERL